MRPPRDREPLGETQLRMLAFIINYRTVFGRPPFIRVIGQAMGLASTSTVWTHLCRLRREGWVTWEPGKTGTLVALAEVVPLSLPQGDPHGDTDITDRTG